MAALPCPKPTLEASVRAPPEHHNNQHDHHDEEAQQQQSSPAAADSLAHDDDDDDNSFQGFAIASPLVSVPSVPMPVERKVLEEGAPKSQEAEEEGGLQHLDAASNPSHLQDSSPDSHHKEDEEEDSDVSLPHMELSSSWKGGKSGEVAAKSSLLAPIDESAALLFNPDLLLADVHVKPTTMEEEGKVVPSLSEPRGFPLSAPIEEQAAAFLRGPMTIQDGAREASNKDLPEDYAFREFATLPAENAEAQKEIEKKERGNPDALTLEVKVSKRQGIAPPAPVLSMPIPPLPTTTIKDEDVDDTDDFGDFAHAEFVSSVAPLSAPDAAPLLPPSPPPPSSEAPPLPSPSSKRTARAVLEECFGGSTVTVLSVTKRLRALRELRGVDLRQGLCLNAFQTGAGPCSMTDDVLAKALRPSENCTGHCHHQTQPSQEQEDGKRHPRQGGEEEKEENAISIAWAITSPAPSCFDSVSQGHVIGFDGACEERANMIEKGDHENEYEGQGGDEEEGGDEGDEEEEEVVDEGLDRGLVLPEGTTILAVRATPALSVSSPSLPSELDVDFLSSGVGGGGEWERGWMPHLKQPQQADISPGNNAIR